MPIYEYNCEACGGITSQLILNSIEKKIPSCRACGSVQVQRVLSQVVLHRSETSRLAAFDPGAAQGAEFYQDPRNVGLWAKKRAQQMGVHLGTAFEETVEKARTGKILDGI